MKINISFSLANFASVNEIQISTQRGAVLVKKVGCTLISPDCGKTFQVILKFSNSFGCRIPVRTLPYFLQNQLAIVDFELLEDKEKGIIIVHVLSVNLPDCSFYGSSDSQLLASASEDMYKTASASSAVRKLDVGQEASGREVAAVISSDPTASSELLYSRTPSAAQDCFLVQKCVTLLAEEPTCCLSMRVLYEMLNRKMPGLEAKTLMTVLLENSNLFGLIQDSIGIMSIQLKQMDVQAAAAVINDSDKEASDDAATKNVGLEVCASEEIDSSDLAPKKTCGSVEVHVISHASKRISSVTVFR